MVVRLMAFSLEPVAAYALINTFYEMHESTTVAPAAAVDTS